MIEKSGSEIVRWKVPTQFCSGCLPPRGVSNARWELSAIGKYMRSKTPKGRTVLLKSLNALVTTG